MSYVTSNLGSARFWFPGSGSAKNMRIQGAKYQPKMAKITFFALKTELLKKKSDYLDPDPFFSVHQNLMNPKLWFLDSRIWWKVLHSNSFIHTIKSMFFSPKMQNWNQTLKTFRGNKVYHHVRNRGVYFSELPPPPTLAGNDIW